MPEVRAFVDIAASRLSVWRCLTDWEAQGTWMLGTTVSLIEGDGASVASVLSATTKVGPVAFVDTMTISEWSPLRRCTVDHTGEVVRGTGVFELFSGRDGSTRVVWTETLTLPLGPLGAIGWLGAGPLAHLGMRASLVRFAKTVAA